MIDRLCIDRAGRLLETCERDGVRENYLAPRDHPVVITVAGMLPANDGCAWTFDASPSTSWSSRCTQPHSQ